MVQEQEVLPILVVMVRLVDQAEALVTELVVVLTPQEREILLQLVHLKETLVITFLLLHLEVEVVEVVLLIQDLDKMEAQEQLVQLMEHQQQGLVVEEDHQVQ